MIGWKPWSTSRRAASARLRCHAPMTWLRRAGLEVETFRPQDRRRYRVVVLQKLYDREHLALASELQAQGTRVVFDLCDNHLYNPAGDASLAEQAERLRVMLARADVVTVSTPTLAGQLPCPSCVVRDGVEPPPPVGWLERALPARRAPRGPEAPAELVWFGISACGGSRAPAGMSDLLGIADVLEKLAQHRPLRLTVISDSEALFKQIIAPLDVPTRYREWKSHANLCRLLPLHDVCLIPITRNPFTDCKSPNRLALSLQLGVPVAATGIPSYREFGDFCALDDWEGGLNAYLESAEVRRRHVEAGRAYVGEHHTMEKAAEEWRKVLERLL